MKKACQLIAKSITQPKHLKVLAAGEQVQSRTSPLPLPEKPNSLMNTKSLAKPEHFVKDVDTS